MVEIVVRQSIEDLEPSQGGSFLHDIGPFSFLIEPLGKNGVEGFDLLIGRFDQAFSPLQIACLFQESLGPAADILREIFLHRVGEGVEDLFDTLVVEGMLGDVVHVITTEVMGTTVRIPGNLLGECKQRDGERKTKLGRSLGPRTPHPFPKFEYGWLLEARGDAKVLSIRFHFVAYSRKYDLRENTLVAMGAADLRVLHQLGRCAVPYSTDYYEVDRTTRPRDDRTPTNRFLLNWGEMVGDGRITHIQRVYAPDVDEFAIMKIGLFKEIIEAANIIINEKI